MKLPIEIFLKIESYCDVYSRTFFLMLNKFIRSVFLKKYQGYILYSESTNLVYDTYKVTIHKSHLDLCKFINKSDKEMHIMSRKVTFTNLGRYIVEENNSMRIFDETAYIRN